MTIRRSLGTVFLVLAVLVGAITFYRFWNPNRDTKSDGVPNEDIPEVIRIKGGMLEIATLKKGEVYYLDRRIVLGPVVVPFCPEKARVELIAYYTYRVPLADTFPARYASGKLEVRAPRPKALFPVGFDTSTLQKQIDKCWLVPGQNSMGDLEKNISERLKRDALKPAYIAFAENNGARETVREFVRTWLMTQTEYADLPRDLPIEVTFEAR